MPLTASWIEKKPDRCGGDAEPLGHLRGEPTVEGHIGATEQRLPERPELEEVEVLLLGHDVSVLLGEQERDGGRRDRRVHLEVVRLGQVLKAVGPRVVDELVEVARAAARRELVGEQRGVTFGVGLLERLEELPRPPGTGVGCIDAARVEQHHLAQHRPQMGARQRVVADEGHAGGGEARPAKVKVRKSSAVFPVVRRQLSSAVLMCWPVAHASINCGLAFSSSQRS